MNESKWFKETVANIFGEGGQTAFARFMRLAGDDRGHVTILRSISNYATGKYAIPGEIRVILGMIKQPDRVKRLVSEAKRDAPAPAFKLLPIPNENGDQK